MTSDHLKESSVCSFGMTLLFQTSDFIICLNFDHSGTAFIGWYSPTYAAFHRYTHHHRIMTVWMWKEGARNNTALDFCFLFPPQYEFYSRLMFHFFRDKHLKLCARVKKEGLGTKIVFSSTCFFCFVFCISQQSIPVFSLHSLWDIFLCVMWYNRNDQSHFVNFLKDNLSENVLSANILHDLPFSVAHPEKQRLSYSKHRQVKHSCTMHLDDFTHRLFS